MTTSGRQYPDGPLEAQAGWPDSADAPPCPEIEACEGNECFVGIGLAAWDLTEG